MIERSQRAEDYVLIRKDKLGPRDPADLHPSGDRQLLV
jgi:hypothetical protein